MVVDMDKISIIAGIVGMITGITGMIISCLGVRDKKFEVIHEFLNGMDDLTFINARSVVYNKEIGEPIAIDDTDVAFVVNYFHHWGIFVKKKYLPMWVFDYGSGAGVIRLYERSESFIKQRREKNGDNTYASGFEWLYYKLKKREERKKVRSSRGR